MKLIDKFLKMLKTSRNTFATFVLTLVSVYLAVDRIVEMLIMIFTGVSVSYWGPIAYTFALACPVFAFLFSLQSEFVTSKTSKVTLFYIYIIGIYIIAISMFTQWLNMTAWLLFLSVPNYTGIITEFADLVKPAFTALSLYIPLITVFPLIKKIILGVGDSQDMQESIWDYKGIGLTNKTEGKGPYSCEIYLFNDKENGRQVKIMEPKRFLPLLVCGGSGTGKTSLVFEPMMARDIEKKYFFREVSKEMGFTALKTGIATLNCPYGNEYINNNFNLNMLKPAYGKDTLYKAYMKKLILSDADGLTYKNLGITCMSPDYEVISNMIDVCNNYQINYNVIDPSSINSLGINPFVYDDPTKIAITISSVLKGMYNTVHDDKDSVYDEDVSRQTIENLAILLKEIYPKMNEGALPNLEDLLKLLTNFELVEKMCRIMETEEDLAEKYAIQLAYFKRNFYKGGEGVQETKRAINAPVSQLDNLLRMPGVKSVLCNRYENINFERMLADGEVTFICTRRGDLGATNHKAFGLFFLLSMQNAVLSRPGIESSRVPNFFYIDEFPDFISKSTEAIFTMYRKYKVGVIISTQTLSQLGGEKENERYKETILANCSNKILTGGTTPEEAEWWSKEFNKRRKWTYGSTMDGSKLEYDSKMSNIKYDWSDYLKPAKIMSWPFKTCGYKIQTDSKPIFGEGGLNFLEAKYKEPKSVKTYQFTTFSGGEGDPNNRRKRQKFNAKKVDFTDNRNEFNPVQTDTTDSEYEFDDSDAITTKLKRKKG